MNIQLKIAPSTQKRIDASLRKALGEKGRNMVEKKQAKLIYIDGTWWLIDMLNRKVGEKDA
jgi:hypothetical protein